MEVTENLEPDAELRIVARNPDTGEERVLIDTEAGIDPPEGFDVEVIPESEFEEGEL